MKQVTTNTFLFEELSPEGQQKALENYYDINVDYDWWDWIYDEIEPLGIHIIGFDTYRGSISIELSLSTPRVWDNLTAFVETDAPNDEKLQDIIDRCNVLIRRLNDNPLCPSADSYNEDIWDKMTEVLIEELEKYYLGILSQEYDYQTSKEAIKESLIANEYYFTEDGKIFRH